MILLFIIFLDNYIVKNIKFFITAEKENIPGKCKAQSGRQFELSFIYVSDKGRGRISCDNSVGHLKRRGTKVESAEVGAVMGSVYCISGRSTF